MCCCFFASNKSQNNLHAVSISAYPRGEELAIVLFLFFLGGSSGSFPLGVPLLGIKDGLELRWSLETCMVGMFLVEVVVRLRAKLRGELFKDAGEDAVDGFLLRGVAVPNGDVVGIEADTESDAAELVICRAGQKTLLVSLGKPRGEGDRGAAKGRCLGLNHTGIKGTLKLLADGEELHTSPYVRTGIFWDAEGP